MSIARNASYDYVSTLAVGVMGAIAGIFLSRAVKLHGTEVYYTITVIAVSYGTNFLNFGMRSSNQYFTGRDSANASACHTLTILYSLASSALVLSVAWLFRDALFGNLFSKLNESEISLLRWSAMVLPLSMYNFAWGGMLIGLGRVRQLAIFNFCFYMADALLIMAVLLVFRGGLREVILVWAIRWSIGVVAMFLILRDYPPSLRIDLSFARQAISYGLRAFLGDFASNIMLSFRNLFLAGWGERGALAAYMKADGYGAKFYSHNDALGKGAFRSVTATTREDAARLTCRLVRNTLFLGGLVWIAGGCAGSVMLWLNGPEFVSGIVPLWILMFGPWIMGGSRMLAMYYTGQRGKPQIPSALAWVGVIIHIPLVILGLRWGGMAGLAAATSLTWTLHFGLYLLLFAGELRMLGLPLSEALFIRRADLRQWREAAVRVIYKIRRPREAITRG